MSEKEKKRFQEMADRDKKRYELEMQDYVPAKGEKRGKKRRHTKDPNAPKRSLSAFFWFCNDERSKIKGMNPQYGIGDIAKELGKLWSEISPDTKRKYEAMAERDKARYGRVSSHCYNNLAYPKKATSPITVTREKYHLSVFCFL